MYELLVHAHWKSSWVSECQVSDVHSCLFFIIENEMWKKSNKYIKAIEKTEHRKQLQRTTTTALNEKKNPII